jgi:L-seryl-tRNA(Ser) seleniumtransferase
MQYDEIRKIPGVDKFLLQPELIDLKGSFGSELVIFSVRKVFDKEREEILQGAKAKNINELVKEVKLVIDKIIGKNFKPVINATGVILHTNLGRAPLGKEVLQEIEPILIGYSNLEFNLSKANRGERTDHIRELINFITGAEDSTVVNNNAAAILLSLKIFSDKKEVIISRGELVEIGGSFRIPEIMKASGAKMVEVGTTNRTRLEDYEKAITKNTRILFKANKSNFFIDGYTEEVDLSSLSQLAKKHNLILIYDAGSGLISPLVSTDRRGLAEKSYFNNQFDEPDIRESISAGADLVCFSCDKLLGGPQAGIIAGKKELIAKLIKAPLMRALRVDKFTISALSSVLKLYLRKENLFARSPVFMMINRSKSELHSLAEKLLSGLKTQEIKAEIVESKAQCGGGTLPRLELDSYAVKLIHEKSDKKISEKLFKKLLAAEKPVLGILKEGELFFDIFTIQPDEVDEIVQNIINCSK